LSKEVRAKIGDETVKLFTSIRKIAPVPAKFKEMKEALAKKDAEEKEKAEKQPEVAK
jgi:hypothetical protein